MGFHEDVERENTFIALIYGEIKKKEPKRSIQQLQKENLVNQSCIQEKNGERNFHFYPSIKFKYRLLVHQHFAQSYELMVFNKLFF